MLFRPYINVVKDESLINGGYYLVVVSTGTTKLTWWSNKYGVFSVVQDYDATYQDSIIPTDSLLIAAVAVEETQ